MRLLLLAAVFLAGCSDADKTEATLKAHGFTEIRTTGYSFFGCGKDDTFSTGFKAKSPIGAPVEGVVCCGILKGCTVRL